MLHDVPAAGRLRWRILRQERKDLQQQHIVEGVGVRAVSKRQISERNRPPNNPSGRLVPIHLPHRQACARAGGQIQHAERLLRGKEVIPYHLYRQFGQLRQAVLVSHAEGAGENRHG